MQSRPPVHKARAIISHIYFSRSPRFLPSKPPVVSLAPRFTLFHMPEKLPNLRYVGVGPLPSQIIRDVPATKDLLKLA